MKSEYFPATVIAADRPDSRAARGYAAARLAHNPDDEQAWLILSQAAETPAAQSMYLQRVLQVNPENRAARAQLARLSKPAATPSRLRALAGWLAFAAAALLLALVALGTAPILMGERTFVVMSGSMAPAIPEGAIAIARPAPVQDLRVGDVVVFTAGANAILPVIHRISGVREQGGTRYFTTRGDANPSADASEVSLPASAWVVRDSLPFAGYLISFATSRTGVIVLIGIPLSLLAGLGLLDWWNKRRSAPGWAMLS
jgi:signal peptidase I